MFHNRHEMKFSYVFMYNNMATSYRVKMNCQFSMHFLIWSMQFQSPFSFASFLIRKEYIQMLKRRLLVAGNQ